MLEAHASSLFGSDLYSSEESLTNEAWPIESFKEVLIG